jgi:uncharacterized protein
MAYRYEWDSRKAESNTGKHGVTFDEASTVFDDPLALIFSDDMHSADEACELIIGHSLADRLLIVCFVDHPGEVIRLISARLTTRKEQLDYENYRSS